jgi:ABC-type multidrug transport system fused ATPase/permease subunit
VRNATFHYPGSATPALRGLNVEVPAGSLVAVTGPVGSGKSALARALLGVYPLSSGAIRVDGRPFAELSSVERRGRVGYLPQNVRLFSGTLARNIAFDPAGLHGDGVPAHAIEVAALAEDLAGLPDGLDTEVGDSGVRVSGGQRQRVGLARALAAGAPHAPPLLVLDDPFSAVDVATEAAIVTALREACGPGAPLERRATVVLCSHRLAGFRHADVVLVLDRGEVVEQGTHAELVAAGGLYARIYRAQRAAESLPVREAVP